LNAAAPGTGEEAAAVVGAVLPASPADELDWIEWKSTFDLSSKPVQGTLARHILGMANRLPESRSSRRWPGLRGGGGRARKPLRHQDCRPG
jgi:hypothetical protein